MMDDDIDRTALQAAAAWMNPASRPVVLEEDNTLLVALGRPVEDANGAFWLDATVGPAPLTAAQSAVVDALFRAGAWASQVSIPVELHPEIAGMLDAGLLYAFSMKDSGFYRSDLVPALLMETDTPLEIDQEPGDLFEMITVGVPRGNEDGQFPAILLRVLDKIDGKRSAEDISQAVVAKVLDETETAIEVLSATEREQAEQLTVFARLSLVLATQAGLVGMDLR